MIDVITISCLTGFFGDTLLQIATKYFGFDWGLRQYFIQHGSGESLCIAAGMMTLFYIVYLYILLLPLNYFYLGIYGIILDYIFRKTMVFKSLSLFNGTRYPSGGHGYVAAFPLLAAQGHYHRKHQRK